MLVALDRCDALAFANECKLKYVYLCNDMLLLRALRQDPFRKFQKIIRRFPLRPLPGPIIGAGPSA